MISDEYLNIELEKSKRDNRTSNFFRKFIFKIVDEALIEIYGENYSIRCAQASEAIKVLLESFGIKSRIFLGHVCLLLAHGENNYYKFFWGGFWEDTLHMFNLTEFDEIVDLTISQLHLEPTHVKKNTLPVLPFWWQPRNSFAPIVSYISKAPAKYGVPNDDKERFQQFLSSVNQKREYYLKNSNPDEIEFGDIIYNLESINILLYLGNPWLNITNDFIKQNGIEYPAFFINKINK